MKYKEEEGRSRQEQPDIDERREQERILSDCFRPQKRFENVSNGEFLSKDCSLDYSHIEQRWELELSVNSAIYCWSGQISLNGF